MANAQEAEHMRLHDMTRKSSRKMNTYSHSPPWKAMETPRPQVPSTTFAKGEERPQGRSEELLPAEPLPPLPPPWRPQDNAQPLFRRGLGREAGLGPVPSGRSVPLPPPFSAAPAAHRWFSAREGQAPALLYNNRALRAGNALPCRRGPSRATPSSGLRPVVPAPRRLGRALGQYLPHYLLALQSGRDVPRLQALRQDFPMPRRWWGQQADSARPSAPRPGSPARPSPLSEAYFVAQKRLTSVTPTPRRAVGDGAGAMDFGSPELCLLIPHAARGE
ncbi:protein IQ-DOMAIN 14-like [Pteropus medius]|uniref:protein IQ-DOMAIN 14-like n=1 Tax=Pteropus vampyrus TaxID=132908 RepID=UPI00196ABADA|nr:protein IQ-DOMAIN 14-like [Pteropus giganteus]